MSGHARKGEGGSMEEEGTVEPRLSGDGSEAGNIHPLFPRISTYPYIIKPLSECHLPLKWV